MQVQQVEQLVMNMNIDQSILKEKTDTSAFERGLQGYLEQVQSQARELEDLRALQYDTSARLEQLLQQGSRPNSVFFSSNPLRP